MRDEIAKAVKALADYAREYWERNRQEKLGRKRKIHLMVRRRKRSETRARYFVRQEARDCLRELKKIKTAWPDLHYSTPKGVLLLSPSPPRIAPSQLRLVE